MKRVGKRGKYILAEDKLADRQTDRKTERQKDRKTERQKDRKTERQKDRKTERQKTTDRNIEVIKSYSVRKACHSS